MSKGIDISINQLLTDFTARLWTNKVRSFYGRVFRNERFEIGKISPEIWITPNNHIEVLKDNSKDAQCFFDVQPNETVNVNIHTATVWLCFMVNLSKIHPELTRTEATERIQTDVEHLLIDSNFKIEGMVRGYEGFKGYDFGKDAQALADVSPNYLFRFNLSCTYINSNCN
jgi:hypothetical protein